MAGSAKTAVDLLAAWSKEGASEEILRISILQAWNGWTEEVLEIPTGVASRDQLTWALSVFSGAVGKCSDTVLGFACHKWSSALVHLLQGAEDAAILQMVCRAVAALLDRVHSGPDAVWDFTTHQLPALLSGLLQFAGAQELLQSLALPVVAQCLGQFPAASLQAKAALRSWAMKGVYVRNTVLSQECGRLLVLLARGPEQWSQLLSELIAALHFILEQLYLPVETPLSPSSAPLGLPTVPVAEPHRSSVLLWQVVAVSRLLCYALRFPPKAAVMVPVEALLSVTFHGLCVQQVTRHSPEALLLTGLLPVMHTVMWNVMAAVVHSCRRHLLPFSAAIELCFHNGFSMLLSAWGSCHGLWLALARTLQAWVTLRREVDPPFLAAAVRWLIAGARRERKTTADVGPTAPKRMRPAEVSKKEPEELYLASVCCLSYVVETVASSFPLKQAEMVSRLPRELLAEGPPLNVTEALLHLLRCCLVSGHPPLLPSLSAAVQVFSQYSNYPNHKVRALCVDALAVCGSQQYPTVPCVTQPGLPEHLLPQPPVSRTLELVQWTSSQDQPFSAHSPVVVEKDSAHSPAQCEGVAGQNLEEGVARQNPEEGVARQNPEEGMAGQNPEEGVARQNSEEGMAGQNLEEGVAGQNPEEGVARQNSEEGVAGQNLEEGVAGQNLEGPSMEEADSDNSSDYELLKQFRDTSPDS